MFKAKCNSSNIWRGLVWSSQGLSKGIKLVVGNGKDVCFWLDVWLEEKPLMALALQPILIMDRHPRVSSYWEEGRGW